MTRTAAGRGDREGKIKANVDTLYKSSINTDGTCLFISEIFMLKRNFMIVYFSLSLRFLLRIPKADLTEKKNQKQYQLTV